MYQPQRDQKSVGSDFLWLANEKDQKENKDLKKEIEEQLKWMKDKADKIEKDKKLMTF